MPSGHPIHTSGWNAAIPCPFFHHLRVLVLAGSPPPMVPLAALRAQWHPSTPVVATACTDFKCRIFSAYLKNVDGKAVSTPWGDNPKFGTLFYEVESAGWVRNVAFSPSGDTLAFCSHNATVSFVDVVSGTAPQVVRLSDLPLTQLTFLPDGSLLGVGHCYEPLLFTRTAAGWAFAGKLKGKAAEGGDRRQPPMHTTCSRRRRNGAVESGARERQVVWYARQPGVRPAGLQQFHRRQRG